MGWASAKSILRLLRRTGFWPLAGGFTVAVIIPLSGAFHHRPTTQNATSAIGKVCWAARCSHEDAV